ncbi:MAG: cell wall-binding repeat-containing protein [Actinomycetaceae bacterium]|nr:cell wall-binding repeat-containing protein [Actinomycetaceae bacterium]
MKRGFGSFGVLALGLALALPGLFIGDLGRQSVAFADASTISYAHEGLVPANATGHNVSPGAPTLRLAGSDRYSTNLEVIKAYAGKPTHVLIASGTSFADALTASALSAKIGAPLVLSDPLSLSATTQQAIRATKATQAIIIGGTSAISEGVSSQVQQITGSVPQRIAGDNRYATAAQLSRQWDSASTVFLASGESFADALSAASGASVQDKAPVLLTSRNGLDAQVAERLRRLAPTKVILAGGTAVIEQSVATQVTGLLPGASLERLGGVDRYETSSLFATRFYPQTGSIVLTSGTNFPDALSAVPFAAANKAPLLLMPTKCESPTGFAYRQATGQAHATLIGGAAVIAENALGNVCGTSVPTQAMQRVATTISGCAPEQAAARSSLPTEQRPWCPDSQYFGPVTSITPVQGANTLTPGFNGVKVSIVQHRLGLGSRWETMDSATISAVRRFQASVGLPVNGVVDQRTFEAMNTGFSWDVDAWQAPVMVRPDATRHERVEQLVNFTASKMGLPYTWGGAGDGGLGYDCSGLILQGMYTAGVDPQPITVLKHAEPPYRTSNQFYFINGLQHVPLAQRQRGDILFWRSGANGPIVHVGLYLGDNTFLEAYPPDTHIRAFTTANPGAILPEVVRPIADDRQS